MGVGRMRDPLDERAEVSETTEGTTAKEDPLSIAFGFQERAARVGFDWEEVSGPLAKLHEE
jgi:hypothetical protein